MENKVRPKMPPAERAKQFAPFAALRGLPACLAQQEQQPVARKILSADMAEQLDRTLQMLRPGHMVQVVYYSGGEYKQITGMVAAVESHLRLLQVVRQSIPFDDLFEIRLL